MKKIFLLLCSITFGLSASSQNLSVPQYGIKAGVNCSNLNFTQYNYLFFDRHEATEGYAKPNTESNIGVKAGVFIDIKLTATWYISPSISYSQFGATTKLDRTFDIDTVRTYGEEINTYKMDYVTLDPIFEYRPTNRITLCIGPSVSYLISNNLLKEVTDNGSIRSDLAYNDEINGVSDIDVGLMLGTSFFLTENFDIDLNLYIGMMELEDIDDGYNRFTQSTSLSLGYIF